MLANVAFNFFCLLNRFTYIGTFRHPHIDVKHWRI
ncbi:hypothetical protein MED222_06415 [Vibrio sp. MED222]|nr:hypothetical protein MED222_06415 [Vibrio sp. MED222]